MARGGKPWYNNGEVEIQVGKDEVIPDGFNRGRLKLTPEQKEQRIQKFLQTMSNKSEDELNDINKRRSQSLRVTYANKTQQEKDEIISKRVSTMNSKSDEEKALYRKHLSDGSKGKNAGKSPWIKGLTKETDKRVADLAKKVSQTNKQKAIDIKISNPQYFDKWRQRVSTSMKQNRTYGKSQDEERYYNYLIRKFGEDDVVRQYRDERYPFDCDFYIKSLDLFIECNFHWTHGGKPYDRNDVDCEDLLNFWLYKAKESSFYKNAIYVWTNLDVRKQQIAKSKNLNYKVLYDYKEDL